MEQIKKHIEDLYRLDVEDIKKVSSGNTTEKYLVTISSAYYLLRIRREHVRPDVLTRDHKFLAFLFQHQLPVPRIIPTHQGSSYQEVDGRLFELQTYLEHDRNLDQVDIPVFSNQLFSLLGKFHQVSSQYPERINKPPYYGESLLPLQPEEKYFRGPIKYGIPRYLAASHQLEPGDRSSFIDDIHFFRSYLEKTAVDFRKQLHSGAVLVNHNDFYGNNILIDGKIIAGLVDFDFCLTSLYAVDLIEALHGSMIWRNDQARFLGLSADPELRLDLGRENLRNYFNHNPDFPVDGSFMLQLLITKVISLSFYPAFDFWRTPEEKLEGFQRMKKIISRMEEINSLEI